MKFHLSKHQNSKVIRPVLESPWSAVFKTTITFKFSTYQSEVFGCQTHFMIPTKSAKNGKKSQKVHNFQVKFHLSKHHNIKVIRPVMESPWSVVFKTTITFNFLAYSGIVLGCQRKFPILPKTAKNGKNRQKWSIFKWNSTQLDVLDAQKKIYPHFLHTIRHSKNNSHFTKSHFCYFQLYPLQTAECLGLLQRTTLCNALLGL